MTLELNRNEIRDLIMACTHADIASREDTKKWRELHDKLKAQLNEQDNR